MTNTKMVGPMSFGKCLRLLSKHPAARAESGSLRFSAQTLETLSLWICVEGTALARQNLFLKLLSANDWYVYRADS